MKNGRILLVVSVILFAGGQLLAEFSALSGGGFDQDIAALKSITPLPDNRSFMIETVEPPVQLGIDEISANQSQKGSNWFSGGAMILKPDLDGLIRSCNEDHAAMERFFDNVVAASDKMSVEKYSITATLIEDTYRRKKRLALHAPDDSFTARVNQDGFCYVALLTPAEPSELASVQVGQTVVLNVSVYKLFAAYGSHLPTIQRSSDIDVKTFYSKNNEYIGQNSTELTVDGGVVYYKWRPSYIVVVAGWSMGVMYDTKAKEFILNIGKYYQGRPTVLSSPRQENVQAEFSLLEDEQRFPLLAGKREEARKAEVALKQQQQQEAQQKQYEQQQQISKQQAEQRARIIEENKPRQKFWTAMSLLVVIVSLVPVLMHVYAHAGIFHAEWKMSKGISSKDVKTTISVIWLGYFLAMGLVTFGKPRVDGSLLNAWALCGIGGVVAMLFAPWGRNMFRRTDQERLDAAVSDAVHRATGRVDAAGVFYTLFRVLILPIIIGGLFCPFLWIFASGKSIASAYGKIKNKGQQTEETTEPAEEFSGQDE